MGTHLRPRPSAIDLLPEECEGIVAWAFQELANTRRSQVEIYAEFKQQLIALQGELGLGFDIPHFSSFNRHSMRLGRLSRKRVRAQEIAHAVASQTSDTDADEMTQATTLMLKTLLMEVIEGSLDKGVSFKEAKDAATAVRQLSLAETTSTSGRQKLQAEKKAKQVEADMKANAEKALDTLSREPGISKEAIARARRDFLGVRPKQEKKS